MIALADLDIQYDKRIEFNQGVLIEHLIKIDKVKVDSPSTYSPKLNELNSYTIDTNSDTLIDSQDLTDIQKQLLEIKRDSLYEVVRSSIKWADENSVQKPTDDVFDRGFTLLKSLAEKNIFPDRMSPSIEEGLCLNFRINDLVIYLELYNDGEIGYLTENVKNKKIIENEDLNSILEFIERIEEIFNS